MFGKKRPSLTEQRRARRPEGGQGPRPSARPGRPGDDQGHPDRRRHAGADGQPDHPGLPAQGQDRGRRPPGPVRADWARTGRDGPHDRRGPRQGDRREGGHPRRQERDRRRLGQGGRGQVDHGRGHRLRPAGLRGVGRPDGRRRLRAVDPPPRRGLGPADGPWRADPADRGRRPEADVDGLPARARQRRDHARADAPRDHAAVPPPGRLGPARLPGDRPAAGDRRRAADPGAGAAPDRGRGRLHAAGGRPARRRPRHRDVPPAQGAASWG